VGRLVGILAVEEKGITMPVENTLEITGAPKLESRPTANIFALKPVVLSKGT
jgi:hypothetical protein